MNKWLLFFIIFSTTLYGSQRVVVAEEFTRVGG